MSTVDIQAARDLYRRARDSGFYPPDDLKLFADRLKSGEWDLADVEFLVTDAEQQSR